MATRRPRVAIAHDYLTQRGGAERVVLAMHRAFPAATIYTTLYAPESTYPEFRDARIVTSELNRIPLLRRDHRLALPFLSLAASGMRIEADVVIASSSGWAHGFRTSGKLLVYCHSPARWLYLTDQYLGLQAKRTIPALAVRALRMPLTSWDKRAAARSDHYWANSTIVRERIRDVYGIDAELLYPPYGLDHNGPAERPAGATGAPFHLLVARLLPYKNIDQVITAYNGRDEQLLIVGDGPMRDQLIATAPPNVSFAPRVDDAELRWCYQHAEALIAASHEDFGLTILEAAACGTPAVALRAGGFLDTVVEGSTGLFFDEPSATAISGALDELKTSAFDRDAITEHAARFGEAQFAEKLRSAVDRFGG
ncbi:MAG: glycosyltransferase [Allobranchiibius sp.]